MPIHEKRFESYSVLSLALLFFCALPSQRAHADDTILSTTTKNTTVNKTTTPDATISTTTRNTIVTTSTTPATVIIASATPNSPVIGSRPGISIGGGAMYTSPREAQQGTLYGEAQLRVHMTSVFALEGLAGYEQNKFSGSTVNVFPVQASLLIYLLPGQRVSPYILGGGGWYYTQVQGQSGAQNRFGPHAGAGLEVFLTHCWSIDGSWRYIWNENIHSQDANHPFGQNFNGGGFMVTTAINYHF